MTELGRIKNVANQLWDIIDTARSNFGEDGYKALNKAVEAVQDAWWVCKNGQEEKLRNAYHTPVNNSRKPIKSSEDKEDEDTVDEKMRNFINQVEKDFHCEVFDNFGKSSVYLKLNSEPDVIKKLDYKKSNGEYQVSGEPVDFITKEDIENELDALMSKKKFGLDKDTYEETVEYILSFFEEKYFPESAKQAVADWYNDTIQFFPEMFEKGEKRKLASAAYLKKIRSAMLIKSSRRR